MKIEFFMAMDPPTITHQMKGVAVKNGKAYMYNSAELNAARIKLKAYLAGHVPERPLKGPVWLGVKWCFPIKGDHRDGEYKTSKPDADNLEKMLKDIMQGLGFFKDDAQVVSEHVEKFWARIPGIYITAWELDGENV